MSLKKNFLYNSILTVSNYVFPFLTFPYVTRVLGVENIGLSNFVDSIINYFILFSMMGISATGIREVAKHKGNRQELNKAFSSLFMLNAISSLIVFIILGLSILIFDRLNQNWELMVLGAIKLIFNLFLTEWFFKGLEDFKFITFRSIVSKAIFVISVFLFVRTKNDVIIYYGLLVGMVVINSIFNSFYRRKIVSFDRTMVNIKEYVKPFLTIGFYLLLTSMYTTFNVTYLGFITNDTQVGYYTTATKLFTILLSFFSAFTAIMLPRMSSLVVEEKIDELKELITKSYSALIAFAVPLIFIFEMYASKIVYFIAGTGYEGAVIPMKIIAPLLLVIGIEQILVLQILMPLKNDRLILINSITGAVIGVSMNIIFVAKLGAVGSSVVWLLSETSVLIIAQYFVKKKVSINFPFDKVLLNLLYGLPIVAILYATSHFLEQYKDIVILVVGSSISLVYFGVVQVYLIKNPLIVGMYNGILRKILRKV